MSFRDWIHCISRLSRLVWTTATLCEMESIQSPIRISMARYFRYLCHIYDLDSPSRSTTKQLCIFRLSCYIFIYPFFRHADYESCRIKEWEIEWKSRTFVWRCCRMVFHCTRCIFGCIAGRKKVQCAATKSLDYLLVTKLFDVLINFHL